MTLIEDPATVDFTDPHTFDDPWELFEWLRSQDKMHYDEANDLYIAARHEDVFHVSRDNDLYCSRFGVRPAIAGEMSLITLDGQQHVDTRRLINQGFTPRRVRELVPHIRNLTNEIVDEIAEKGEIDFVADFAIHVPLIIICEMMGLDPEQRLKMYKWSDAMMAGDGHTEADDPVLLEAAEFFGEYALMCVDLIAQRRASPEDDLISVLTQAFDDGKLEKDFVGLQGITEEELARRQAEGLQLDDEDVISFLVILLVAGNETTRNAISGGLIALSEFPEQKQLLIDNLDDEDFMNLAVEELIRYVSPVMGFLRTVTADHTYGGRDLKEGDRVLMLYGSANRDERAIENPNVLDLTRDPNPHLAFGIGPHYCLGANLARAEVRIVFQELLKRLPDIKVAEDFKLVRGESSLVLSLQDIPAEFTKCPVPH